MVYYFTSNVVEPPATIYVGKDKFENEELIKHGWEEDFHVDNLSSAHVYLRLRPEQSWDKIPPKLIEDCVQLTKANSIEGNKKDNVSVIYTPWGNLQKAASMAVGQVGFHDPKRTRLVHVATRQNPVVNRLSKTRTIASADTLFAEKEAHLAELRQKAREKAKEVRKEEERVKRERKEEKWKREHAYDELMSGEGGRSNEEGWDEEDFM